MTIAKFSRTRPRNLLEYFLQPGLSVRIVLIAWALAALLSQENLLSNWLAVLKQERLEIPVETAQDVVNRGLRVIALSIDGMKGVLSSGRFPELGTGRERDGRLGMDGSVMHYSQTSQFEQSDN